MLLAACAGTPPGNGATGQPGTERTNSFLENGSQPGAGPTAAMSNRSSTEANTPKPEPRWPDSRDDRANPAGAAPEPGAERSAAVATDAAHATTESAMSALAPIADAGSNQPESDQAATPATAPPDSRPHEPVTVADLRAHERRLREALLGPDPVGAALDLAALLADLERHREARHVLLRARADQPNPALAVAIAGIQRDLGQRHLAVAELRTLRDTNGAVAMHPGLLFELAELEWLEGEGGAATKTLLELRRIHATDDWTRGNTARLDGLINEINSHDRPQRVALRDLLGNLRGADSPTVRLRTLEQLVAMTRQPDAAPGLQALERRVLAVGVGDASSAVRARAIQLGPVGSTDRKVFCSMALADRDPLVRRVAAERAAELLGSAAGPLLTAQLAGERDAATFVAIDNTLRRLASEPETDGLTQPDAVERRAILERWQERFGAAPMPDPAPDTSDPPSQTPRQSGMGEQ